MDVTREQMEAVVRLRAASDQKRFVKDSQVRLERAAERKLRTSFIGDLARFESYFGALWGHGKQDHELTPEERRWRQVWHDCRTEVLNNGNSQLRALKAELRLYEVTFLGYRLKLPVRPEQGEAGE